MGEEKRAGILIVDDNSENLTVLSSLLSKEYDVSVAKSGERALEILQSGRLFDLILLDIIMPEMDGFKLCSLIKADERFKDIPIIFISALTEIESKVKGFQMGGVDYITKPFQKEEVLARVKTHLTIRELTSELIEKNKRLEEANKKLMELERLRENLTNMIVHDMRSPLTAIMSMFELLKMELEGKAEPQVMHYIGSGINSAKSLIEMINSLLDISRLEEGKMPLEISRNRIGEIVDDAMKSLEPLIIGSKYEVRVEKNGLENVVVNCDREIIKRVILNLVTNSLKHSMSKSPIKVTVSLEDGFVVVSVIDDGIGIPKDYHQKIFEKFGQVEMRERRQKYSTGLGLTFCKLAIEAHNGRIGLESEVGKGSRFFFMLPVSKGLN
jgi:signal transduction histidine kinase